MIEFVENEIKELLKATSGLGAGASPRITSFYQGNVVLPPQSYLPALMVFGTNETVIAKSTAKDQYQYEITVRVVVDLKAFFDEAGTGEKIDSQEAIRKIMGERDSSTGAPKSDTVLGVLRAPANIRGVGYLFNNNISVTYTNEVNGKFFYVQADAVFTLITDLILRQ